MSRVRSGAETPGMSFHFILADFSRIGFSGRTFKNFSKGHLNSPGILFAHAFKQGCCTFDLSSRPF